MSATTAPRQGEQLHLVGGRRAWLAWGTGVAVYLVAVFYRSSLGVAGLMAADRFGVQATELAFFTVLQLLVYAGMQIPVGVLLDRFGSKRLLLAGMVTMTAAQLGFAFATNFATASIARGVLGAGDAMIFVSVIRLAALWFPVRQVPVVTQMSGQVGQLGAIAAAGPLSWALHAFGWTKTFAIASSLGLVLLILTLLLVEDSPYASERAERVKLALLARSLRPIWDNPGTRLAMWTHFTTVFSVTVFTMLWGFPFLVVGQGLDTSTASILLMVMTGWVLVSGLGLGVLVARYPYWRSYLALLIVATMIIAWTSVLMRSTPAPLWLLVVLVLATAAGGPASMIGLDLARTFSPATSLGRANGMIIMAGFMASLLAMWLIGFILDLRAPGGPSTYQLADFRVALSCQYLFWAFGSWQMLRYRRRALAHLAAHHPGAIVALRAGDAYVHPDVVGDEAGR